MRTQAPSLAITEAEFRQALVEAEKLTGEELRKVSMAGISRSYYVRYQDKIISLKAVLRLAYIRAGKKWDGPQSDAAARQLRNAFDILHITDATERERLERQRETATRWARPKQREFRLLLLELYESRCAVTGCTVLDAIDAAHIIGVDGEGEDIKSNGIILRADVHRLFDNDLMAINPETGKLHFRDECKADYAEYEGSVLNFPRFGPKLDDFKVRWRQFAAEKDR